MAFLIGLIETNKMLFLFFDLDQNWPLHGRKTGRRHWKMREKFIKTIFLPKTGPSQSISNGCRVLPRNVSNFAQNVYLTAKYRFRFYFIFCVIFCLLKEVKIGATSISTQNRYPYRKFYMAQYGSPESVELNLINRIFLEILLAELWILASNHYFTWNYVFPKVTENDRKWHTH